MYLVTQEPEDHHSRQVPLQALRFLCWGPACLCEKVSKPFASLQWGICVNVNLYLTNRILSLRMYKYLIIYYKCFYQVINEGPWQKVLQEHREEGQWVSRCAGSASWCAGPAARPPGAGDGTALCLNTRWRCDHDGSRKASFWACLCWLKSFLHK